MTRRQIEDGLLALVQAALPAGIKAASLPIQDAGAELARLNRAAVWLVYAGEACAEPDSATIHRQATARRWTALIVAKDYRASASAGAAALELLEAVDAALIGQSVAVPGVGQTGAVRKISDEMLDLPEELTGVVGYQATYALDDQYRA